MGYDLQPAIDSAATAPQSVTTDGLEVVAVDIEKQIAADRYLKANAASCAPGLGIVFRKLIPPGPTSDQNGTLGDSDGGGLG
jgi:hypothetical protein